MTTNHSPMRVVTEIKMIAVDGKKNVYHMRLSNCNHVVERKYQPDRRPPSHTWCDICENPYGALALAVIQRTFELRDTMFLESQWFDVACKAAELMPDRMRKLFYDAPKTSQEARTKDVHGRCDAEDLDGKTHPRNVSSATGSGVRA